jgi:hypothetical protein
MGLRTVVEKPEEAHARQPMVARERRVREIDAQICPEGLTQTALMDSIKSDEGRACKTRRFDCQR